MKRIIPIIAAFILVAALTACGSSSQNETANVTNASNTQNEAAAQDAQKETPEQPKEQSGQPAPEDPGHSEVLVAYFSATGTTKGVAEKLASVTGADLYEILAAEPYTAADLNYNDRSSRSTAEQNDKNARPAIGSEDISLDGYKTIYLGFPIWWGEEPRILDTFVEKYSFEGITVVPFCTSGGSGIGRSGSNMEALAGSGNWLGGKRFSSSVSEAELKSWTEGLK